MRASSAVIARTVYLALSHRRATVLFRPSRGVLAYATQAHATRRWQPTSSVPLSMSARNAYLDGLREAAAHADTPDEVVRVMQMVRAAPAADLEEEGVDRVIAVLGRRKDARLLRALIDSKLFRLWYGSGSLSMMAIAYWALFRALFNPYALCPPPSDSEVYGIITEFKSRGGVMTLKMSRQLASLYHQLGRTPPPEIAEAISFVAELPDGINFDPGKWSVYIAAERRTRSWRDVLTTVLPHLSGKRIPPTFISAMLAQDLWQPSDIEEIAQALGSEPDTGVISRAVENALNSGARAGIEVFRYAQSRGLYLPHSISQRLVMALVAFRNSSVTDPDDILAAVDVFWRQVHPDSTATDAHHLDALPLLGALATTIGIERRWDTIRDILSFFQHNKTAVRSHIRKQFSDLHERLFLSSSHAAAIGTLSAHRDLTYDDLLRILHRIGKFRYDSAPTMSYTDFRTFLAHVESCGHVVKPDMVIEWLRIVLHSRVQLLTSWEQGALGFSAALSHDHLAVTYLRQLEEDLLSKRSSLDTDEVRARLMSVYATSARTDERDVLRCWGVIVDRKAVSDDILGYALRASQTLSILRRVWDDSNRLGVVPSVANWARYALQLIKLKCYAEAFDIFSQRVGDDPTHRNVAVALFARSRQDELEYYARKLPKIWSDPRTRAELLRARAYRRRMQGSFQHPQHYDFIV